MLKFLTASRVQVPFAFSGILTILWWVNFLLVAEPMHQKSSGPLFLILQEFNAASWVTALVQYFLWLGLSFYWNAILERLEILSKRNYLPLLIFGLTTLLFLEQRQFDPILWGMFFIIPALDKLIRIPDQKDLTQTFFDATFLLGVAALIHPMFLLLALFLIPSFFYQKIGVIRYYLVSVVGLFLPLLLLLGIFFLIDRPLHMTLPKLDKFNPASLLSEWRYLPILAVFILSLPNFIRNITVNKMSIRNAWLMLAWFAALSFASSLFDAYVIETGILTASAPLSAFLTQSVLNDRKKKFSALLMLLFFVAWVLVSMAEL